MVSTKHRTSFALDGETAERLRNLARRWNVSQAEVVRRAVKRAAEEAAAEGDSVRERVVAYRASEKISREVADDYLRRAAADRSDWGRDG